LKSRTNDWYTGVNWLGRKCEPFRRSCYECKSEKWLPNSLTTLLIRLSYWADYCNNIDPNLPVCPRFIYSNPLNFLQM
jgi:hypothetical protein